ncbi:MAG: hypothetical protein V1743_05025 [Nanoarchaeota archaeon]
MKTKKDRRHSGYVTPQATVSPKDQKEFFINPIYDEWNNYRDGFRDWFRDSTLIKRIWKNHFWEEMVEKRIKMNKKQKRLLQRRKAMKRS